MSRARLFIENFVVYGLGTMAAKIVPLVMLPIVTSLMPNADCFGYSDLSNTLVSLVQPIAVMGMYDAMFRMYFDDDSEDFRRGICSTALLFVMGASCVLVMCILLLRDPVARLFFGGAEFTNLVLVSAATVYVSAINQIAQAPTRMMNKRGTYIIMNLGTSMLSYAISVPLLISGQYLMALPIAALVTALSASLIFLVLNRKWFLVRAFDIKMLKAMASIGIPLMPSFLFYWVFSSTGRIVIMSSLGAGAAGVFAVAAKIGQISQLVYNAFAQGWQYFAFSTMRDKDQVELNSRIYEYLGVISLLATSFVIAFLDPVYKLLFSAEYARGIVCVPYLFLAPLMLMLYQVAVNQLVVVKKTWPSFLMLAFGTVTCLTIQVALVPMIGIEGAAVGTVAGYFATTVTALAVLTHMNLMAVKKRLYYLFAAFIIYLSTWRFLLMGNTGALCVLLALFALLCTFLYRDEVRMVFRRFSKQMGDDAHV